MYYTRLTVLCDPDFTEILMAELSEAGFDTFLETSSGFEAYVEDEGYDKTRLEEIKDRYRDLTTVHYRLDPIEKKNWNEEWEKSYSPIIVEDKCLIRASFHNIEKKYPYEIIITPKMSFGTGHHQTTYLMIQAQMEIDHTNKTVMDAGCGTAILSIMASKRGAKHVEAFDIDEWSVINGNENLEVNNCKNISLRQGKISDLTFENNFDIILANINKNILLAEIPQYAAYLNGGGLLLLSGFYEKDIPDLVQRAASYNLSQVTKYARESWSALLLKKAN